MEKERERQSVMGLAYGICREVSRKAPQKDSICYVAYDRFKNWQLMLTITHCEHQIKIEVHSSVLLRVKPVAYKPTSILFFYPVNYGILILRKK